MTELMAWNTWLSGDCDTALLANLTIYEDRVVCIGVGSTNITTTTTSTVSGTTTQTTASAGPTPTDTVSGCQQYYTTTDGDDCSKIESEFGITLAQFYQWNPSVGSTCTNLWLDETYCVKGPASTTTISGPSGPTQTGIASNCDDWYSIVSGDSCAQIESTYGITFAQLYEWNPAIGSNCQTLDVGYSVCVGLSS